MLEKDKNFISAVVYVRNCEERIEGFLKMLISILNNSFEHSEIICVNDCSDDQSLDKIRKVSNQSGASCISVINMSYYHGLEMAMNAGDDLAIGDFIFEFDTLDELRDFDDSYINDTRSEILKKVAEKLGIEEKAIGEVKAFKVCNNSAALTSLTPESANHFAKNP